MSVSSLDILNLSHSLKDVCEVNCDTCPGLTNTLRILSQISLIKAHLEYGRSLEPCGPCSGTPTNTLPANIAGKDSQTRPGSISLPEIELPDIQAIIVK
jgi:hypothetical protein